MHSSAEKGRQEMEMKGAETAEAEGLFSLLYYKILMKNARCTRAQLGHQ